MRIFKKNETTLILKFGFNRSLINFVKKLDGARWNPDEKHWTIHNKERNIQALRYYNGGKEISKTDDVIATSRPLYQHQIDMANFAIQRKRAYLAATMGTGKTLTAIEVMEHFKPETVWWVGPKSAIFSVALEMRKWNSVIIPTFLTYEQMTKKARQGYPAPEMIIFDECHKLKTPTSLRTQAGQYYAEKTDIVIMMTGTPAPKNPLDWYSQIDMLYPGWITEGNIHKFKNRLAITEKVDLSEDDSASGNHVFTRIVDWKEHEIKQFREEITPFTIFVDKDECLDLPDKIYIDHVIEPDPAIIKRFNFILNNSRTTIEALNRCRQLSDGFIYFEGKTLRAEKNPKLEALKELVEGKNRMVIFAGFTESINLICEEMRKDSWEVIRIDGRGIDGDIERFMGTEGKIVIVAHPKSGGTGLNLTASDTIIYYSNDFDGESRMQSEDRIHRPGCKGANIIDLIHLPTDKYVAINLRNKKKLQAVTLADLKLNLEEQYEIR
jgi:SNF2 family DNA or RNA helicase